MLEMNLKYSGMVGTKLAYHMGNFSDNAKCNLVDDQPLFYCDDMDESEDELLFNGLFDDEIINGMQKKIKSYDKTASILSDVGMATIDQSFDAVLNATLHKVNTLDDIIIYGQKSAIFQSYYDFIQQYNIDIVISSAVENVSYNRKQSTIYINPHMDVIRTTANLLKTMRIVWNTKQGIMINPLSFQPEEAILINRVLMADLDVIQASFFWDLKLSGDDNAWAMAMGSSDYDLYTAYAVEAMTDFRSIKSGVAPRAAFEKWFMSDRCRHFDRQIIQTMLGSYADIEIENANTSKLVAKDITLRLGHRPMGKNYLSPIVANIIYDELYGEVRDRSNANFLWFITFERRMNELEQHLQDGDDQINKADSGETSEIVNNVHHLPNYQEKSNVTQHQDSCATLFVLDHFRSGS